MNIKQKKSVQAINYFARKKESNSINRLKLIKLLWLSDRYHVMKYGRFMLRDRYVAMPHGPVASMTKDISEGYGDEYSPEYIRPKGSLSIDSIGEVDLDFLSKTEREVMDFIWIKFGEYSQFELRDISHHYPEWKRFEEKLKKTKSSYPMKISDFFVKPENEDNAIYEVFRGLEAVIENSKETLERTSIFSNSNITY
ncbi:MAG: putative phage-associated protein [Crocinitomix sp.]|jgi:uncharacterized phage-associated protein